MQRAHPINSDTRAAAPVVGIVLMVAVAVILVATVGTALSGVVNTSDVAPQAAFSVDQTEAFVIATGGRNQSFTAVTITHESGDRIDHDRVQVRVNGQKAYGINRTGDQCAKAGMWRATGANCARTLWNDSSSVTAGDSITIVHRQDQYTFEGNGYTISSGGPPSRSLYVQNHDPVFGDGNGSRLQLTDGDTIRVIWESESGDTSTTLFETTVRA